MDAVATYTEKTIKSRRKFELHEDKVVLYADFLFGPKLELTISLKDVKPEPDKVFIKTFNPPLYAAGSIIAVISFFLMFFLADKTGGYSAFIFPGGCIIFIIMMVFNPRRAEFSSFKYNSGHNAFDVGCIGKYKKDYPQFIELIKTQIRKTNP